MNDTQKKEYSFFVTLDEKADKLITAYHSELMKQGLRNKKGNRPIGRGQAIDRLFQELIDRELERKEILVE